MLELKNIYKTYSSKNGVTHRALENVSLKFEDKGLVFILGKSGSGKSTLLNLIGGIDDFDRGDIYFNGRSFNSFSEKDYTYYRNSCIGFVFQEFNLLDNLSVYENVALALNLQSKKEDIVDKMLEELEILSIRNRKTGDLTGGQKQRVAIARALIKNPNIILADEPTGSLDSETSDEIIKILQKMSKDRLVIVVTHNKDLAYGFSDRIIEIKDGFVLKDLQRKSNSDEHISKPTLVSANLLIVPKDKYVQKEDIDDLNATIAEKRQDYYIMIDDNKNRVMSLYPNVKEVINDDNKDVFKPYIYNKEDKIIEDVTYKTKLPLKKGIKLGFASLRRKKIKLFFTILLAILAVILTGVASSFTSYSLEDAVSKSIYEDKAQYLEVASSFSVNNQDYKFQEGDINFIDNLDNYSSYVYSQPLKLSFLALSTKVDKLIAQDKLIPNEMLNGFLVTDNISHFGYLQKKFKLIATKKDLVAEDYNSGVIISSIVANTLVKYSQFEDTYGKKLSGLDDIVNAEKYKLRIGSRSFPIIGVYDVENGEIYEHFKQLHDDNYSYAVYREYQSVANSLFLNVVVTETFFENYKHSMDSFQIRVETTSSENRTQAADNIRSVSSIDLSIASNEIQFIDPSWTRDNFTSKIENMADNEVIVGKNFYDNLVNKLYNKARQDEVKQLLDAYNEQNHYLNIIKVGSSLSQKDVFSSLKDIKVVGVLVTNRYDSRLNGFYMKDSIYKMVIDSYYQPDKALIELQEDENYSAIVKSLYDNGFRIDNEFVPYFIEFVSAINKYSSLINVGVVIWFVIVAILLYSFMSGSIKDGSYQIGVLKALGANIKDIYKIYAVEAILIGIFATVFGILGYYFGGLLANSIITENFYTFYFPVFIFKPISILQMTVSTFAVLIIAIIIPMSRIKNIKPIDVMNMVN